MFINYQYNYLFSTNRYLDFDVLKTQLNTTLYNQTIFGVFYPNGTHKEGGEYYDLDNDAQYSVETSNVSSLVLPD